MHIWVVCELGHVLIKPGCMFSRCDSLVCTSVSHLDIVILCRRSTTNGNLEIARCGNGLEEPFKLLQVADLCGPIGVNHKEVFPASTQHALEIK